MINNLEEKYSLALLYLDNENTLDESINILQDLFKKKFKDYEILNIKVSLVKSIIFK